jgi:hypothetical protein
MTEILAVSNVYSSFTSLSMRPTLSVHLVPTVAVLRITSPSTHSRLTYLWEHSPNRSVLLEATLLVQKPLSAAYAFGATPAPTPNPCHHPS